jgi:hypothetical protein
LRHLAIDALPKRTIAIDPVDRKFFVDLQPLRIVQVDSVPKRLVAFDYSN